MKREMTNRCLYIGAGAGLVLFAIIGLIPGSFLGGAIGLNVVGLVFGYPVEAALLPRLIVGVSMVLGVLVSGVVFVTCTSAFGWLTGYVIDAVRYGRMVTAEAVVKDK